MKRSKYSDYQIIDAVKRDESGIGVPDICRELGVSSDTCYKLEFKTLQKSGCGLTTMTAPIWSWADSHISSDWPWLHNVSTSTNLAKGDDYLKVKYAY